MFDSHGRFLREWGTEGTEDGQFIDPTGPAIGGDGNVRVADAANHFIEVLDPEGHLLCKWDPRGVRDGELKFPSGIAVDAAGDGLKSWYLLCGIR